MIKTMFPTCNNIKRDTDESNDPIGFKSLIAAEPTKRHACVRNCQRVLIPAREPVFMPSIPLAYAVMAACRIATTRTESVR